MSIIQVRDLDKKFRIPTGGYEPYVSLRDSFSRLFKFNGNKAAYEDFYALKGLNFDIQEGDRVGIIGRNGAGKSTLLKVLSRITEPTSGKIKISGRVSSLLEVGTGFHPELSGRENIYLNGAILGMTRREIQSKFDQIVEFAEVEKFIDTPVKRYSSGMYVRLAFAIAAHLEPEILIVDEVLAVGDAQFQKKCLGKMDEVSRKEGRTILFVSHNIGAVRALCNRGILLKAGRLELDSDIGSVIERYENSEEIETEGAWVNTIDDNDVAHLQEIVVLDQDNKIRTSFYNNQSVHIKMRCQFKEDVEFVKVGFDLIKDGSVVFRSQQVDNHISHKFSKGTSHIFHCEIPAHFLNHGTYFIRPLFSIHNIKTLLALYDTILKFHVELDKSDYFKMVLDQSNFPGLTFPKLDWRVEHV